MHGGRTAEEIAIGDVTTGAENDLMQATRLARHMVTRWGMGKLGLMSFQSGEHQPFLGYELAQGREYSEATAARIEEEVQQLLEERHEAVRKLLAGALEKLDRLVNVLLQEETVAQERLAEIFGARPVSISVGILTDAETQTIAGSNWGTGMKRLGSLFNAIAAIIVSFSLSAWGADSPLDM